METKEYMTNSINMVAWFKLRGIDIKRTERKNSSILFCFDWTDELNNAINGYLNNKELRGFLEVLRELKMNLKSM
jgi:hypothetical protein